MKQILGSSAAALTFLAMTSLDDLAGTLYTLSGCFPSDPGDFGARCGKILSSQGSGPRARGFLPELPDSDVLAVVEVSTGKDTQHMACIRTQQFVEAQYRLWHGGRSLRNPYVFGK
jgi:hypothetical protein